MEDVKYNLSKKTSVNQRPQQFNKGRRRRRVSALPKPHTSTNQNPLGNPNHHRHQLHAPSCVRTTSPTPPFPTRHIPIES